MRKFIVFDDKLGIFRLQTKYSLADLGTIRSVFSSDGQNVRAIELPRLPPQTEYISHKNLNGYIVRVPYELNVQLLNFCNNIAPHLKKKSKSKYTLKSTEYKRYMDSRNKCASVVSGILLKTMLQERRLGIFNLIFLVIAKLCAEYCRKLIKDKNLPFSVCFGFQDSIRELLSECWQMLIEELNAKDEDRKKYTPYFMGHLKANLGDTYNINFIQNMIKAQACFCIEDLLTCSIQDIFSQLFVPENPKYIMTATEVSQFYYGLKELLLRELQVKNQQLLDFIAKDVGVPLKQFRYLNLNILLFHHRVIRMFERTLRDFIPRGYLGVENKQVKPLKELLHRIKWDKVVNEFSVFAEDLQLSEIIALLWNRVDMVDVIDDSYIKQAEQKDSHKPEVILYDFSADTIINDSRKFALMFLDLRGFTAISDGYISSSDLKRNLYYFFDPIMGIIHHFKGSIRYYAGDGILAIFGEEQANENYILRTLRATIEIQKYFWRLKKAKKVIFSGMGIGIHTGLVDDAYFFLSPGEMSQTIIGFNANLAGRLSSGKAESGQVVMSDTGIFTFNNRLREFLDSLEGVVTMKQKEIIYKMFEQTFVKSSGDKPVSSSNDFQVTVYNGILNNNGIVMSENSFQELSHQVVFKSVNRGKTVDYLFYDDLFHENILFRMEGNARFKGLEGKFPIWSVYPQTLAIHLFEALKKRIKQAKNA